MVKAVITFRMVREPPERACHNSAALTLCRLHPAGRRRRRGGEEARKKGKEESLKREKVRLCLNTTELFYFLLFFLKKHEKPCTKRKPPNEACKPCRHGAAGRCRKTRQTDGGLSAFSSGAWQNNGFPGVFDVWRCFPHLTRKKESRNKMIYNPSKTETTQPDPPPTVETETLPTILANQEQVLLQQLFPPPTKLPITDRQHRFSRLGSPLAQKIQTRCADFPHVQLHEQH